MGLAARRACAMGVPFVDRHCDCPVGAARRPAGAAGAGSAGDPYDSSDADTDLDSSLGSLPDPDEQAAGEEASESADRAAV